MQWDTSSCDFGMFCEPTRLLVIDLKYILFNLVWCWLAHERNRNYPDVTELVQVWLTQKRVEHYNKSVSKEFMICFMNLLTWTISQLYTFSVYMYFVCIYFQKVNISHLRIFLHKHRPWRWRRWQRRWRRTQPRRWMCRWRWWGLRLRWRWWRRFKPT